MTPRPSPIAALLAAYKSGEADPAAQIQTSLSCANGNASHNTYIALDPAWTLAETQRQLDRAAPGSESLPLFGLPVSLKDCFDLTGFPTSSGSKFYAAHKQNPSVDSWVAARLRHAGAIITGKSHLHQLAYGITGENRDYGDCLQPANAALLTGGSSSGAAASIQEGSALAAIGTDTGGSVRGPAALCGLSGYRSSLGIGDWTGGYHLAPSFDTIGWLCRDLRDLPLLATTLFDLPPEQPASSNLHVGVLTGPMLEGCQPEVFRAMEVWQDRIHRASAQLQPFNPPFWSEAWDIYAPLQAHEAAQLHSGFFVEFDPVIAARLEWGASLRNDEIQQLRQRHAAFRSQHEQLFRQFDFLLAPISPLTQLVAGANHTDTRARLLRLTTPASLGGNPAVILPGPGCGLQLTAAHNNDRRLLRFAAALGEQLALEETWRTHANLGHGSRPRHSPLPHVTLPDRRLPSRWPIHRPHACFLPDRLVPPTRTRRFLRSTAQGLLP
jgi:aspartyl-tRNA(Asn)/glutamyl-tRNA(Gln) amidotransferase subunit A